MLKAVPPLLPPDDPQLDKSHHTVKSVATACSGRAHSSNEAHAQRGLPTMSSHRADSCTTVSSTPSSLLFSYPLASSPPLARWAHAACAIRTSCSTWGMLVHGGIGASMMDDIAVLEADSFAWRSVHTSGLSKDRPEKCMGHTAVALNDRVWVFGGQQGRKLLAKLYSLDINSWTWRRHAPTSLPIPRAGHAMVTVDKGPGALSVAFLFGGQGKKLMNDLHVFTADEAGLPNFRELTATGRMPSPRRGHSLVWDGYDTLIVFGGTHTCGIDNALHAYSISRNEWFAPATTGAPPSPRTQHSAAMLGSHAMLIFGGCNAQGTFFSDCYLLDTSSWSWSRPTLLNTAPAPRYHHSCVVLNGRAIVYGGINSKQTFEGIVVVDSKFDNDISHIAEELTAMASGSLFTPLNTGLATNSVRSTDTGLLHGPQTLGRLSMGLSETAVSTPVAASSSTMQAGGSSSQAGGSMVLDLMKAQLTDLLVKRNMEEVQLQTARKAEAAEVALTAERQRCEALSKEVVALKLLVSEAEAERDSWEAKYQEACARATREATQATEAAAEAASLRSQLAEVRRELAGALSLQQGLLKELGVLSSRHSRLQEQHDALRKGATRGAPGAGAAGAASSSHSSGQLRTQQQPPASSSSQLLVRQSSSSRGLPDAEATAPSLAGTPAPASPLPGRVMITAPPTVSLAALAIASASSGDGAAGMGMGTSLLDSLLAGAQSGAVSSGAAAGSASGQLVHHAQGTAFGGVLLPTGMAPPGALSRCSDTTDMSTSEEEGCAHQGQEQQQEQQQEGRRRRSQRSTAPTPTGVGSGTGLQDVAGAALQGQQHHGLSMSEAIVAGQPLPVSSPTAPPATATALLPPPSPAASTQSAKLATSDAACMQLLRLLNASEQARTAATEQVTQLRAEQDGLRQAAREAQAAAAAAQAMADRYAGSPASLAATSLADLRGLELELEGVCRRVREEVVRRAMQQAARKPPTEVCCGICMEGPRAVVFSCGHQACDKCASKVGEACPFCRATISAKIRLFDA